MQNTQEQIISVTRALVELKRFDSRISTAAGNKFVAVAVGRENQKKVHNSQNSLSETQAEIQGSFDKIEALIRNREALKGAIVKSNALTYVTVMNRLITVAEAIELKTSVELRKVYLNNMRHQLNVARNTVERGNAELQSKIETSLNTVYGSEKSKISSELVDQVTKPQLDQKELSLIDPMKIEEKIKKLEAEISEIESELDFVLSESNARTTISVVL